MAELRDLYDVNSNKTDKTYRKGEKNSSRLLSNGGYGSY